MNMNHIPFPGFYLNFRNNLTNPTKEPVSKFLPQVDILENADHFEINMALPGISKEDVKIEFEDGKLNISGERKLNTDTSNTKIISLQTGFGQFSKSFTLPEKTDTEAISAKFENGLLNIVIPKLEVKKEPKTIQVL